MGTGPAGRDIFTVGVTTRRCGVLVWKHETPYVYLHFGSLKTRTSFTAELATTFDSGFTRNVPKTAFSETRAERIKYLRIRPIRRRASARHSETRRRRTASSSSTNLSGFASERSDALLPRTKTCERAGRSRDEKNVGADVRVDVGVDSPRRRERVRGRFRRR